MDKFDQLIVAALRKDARQSVSVIADSISLSRSAVSERIKRLETSGVIRGYQAILGKLQATQIKAYFEITYRDRSCSEIADIFKRIPEVQSCHGISGEIDLLVYLCADSMDSLQQIREHIASHASIAKVKTHIVLSEWVNHLG